MARETKIGMVVGVGFIVCFAVVLSHRGRLGGVRDQSGFDIQSILDDTPGQPDSEQVRRAARKVGAHRRMDTALADAGESAARRPSRSVGRDSTVGDTAVGDTMGRDVTGRDSDRIGSRLSAGAPTAPMTVVAGGPSRTETSIPESTAGRAADRHAGRASPGDETVPVARRLGRSGSRQRFAARRDPVAAGAESGPAGGPIDLTPEPSRVAADEADKRAPAKQRSVRRDVHVTEKTASRRDVRRSGGEAAGVPSVVRAGSPGGALIPRVSTKALGEMVSGHQTSSRSDRVVAATSAAVIGEHTVVAGDTLTRIARRYYHTDDPAVVRAIFDANRDKLKSPDRIVTNRRLVLPRIEGHDSGPVAVPVAAPLHQSSTDHGRTKGPPAPIEHRPPQRSQSSKGRYYVIRPGDTLGRIAESRYGTARPEVLRKIQAANPRAIVDLDRVITGRRIVLPDLGLTAASGHTSGQADAKTARTNHRLVDRATDRTADRATSRSAVHADAERSGPGSVDKAGAASWRWYEIKKGEVYTTLASRLLGSARRWRELAELNRDIFPDPARIRHGVRIRVPTGRGATSTTDARKG